MRFILFICLILLLSSCSSRKKVAKAEEQKAKIEDTAAEMEEISSEKAETETTSETTEPEDVFCAKNEKMWGYRIQVYFSKERKKWQSTEKEIAANFPNLDIQMEYSPPHYRILVGQYLDKTAAQPDLIKLKRDYTESMVIPWKIWCKEALKN